MSLLPPGLPRVLPWQIRVKLEFFPVSPDPSGIALAKMDHRVAVFSIRHSMFSVRCSTFILFMSYAHFYFRFDNCEL
jgi:hypothetical protein